MRLGSADHKLCLMDQDIGLFFSTKGELHNRSA